MKIGVPQETYPRERRVALTPDALPMLAKAGHAAVVQSGAGDQAGYPDRLYREKGAEIADSRAQVFRASDAIVQVRGLGANPQAGRQDLELMREGQIIIAQLDPLWRIDSIQPLADRKVIAFALELMPRITRAQTMDVLSSQATVAGYKAVLVAADTAPRMFPMLMTAAGTITAAHVFVIGAGVAGLQAIATSKRLGAIVKGYDVRPAVKEQVESLGAKFVEVGLETAAAEDKSGYAKDMGEEFIRKQREKLTEVVAESHVVITTAAIPGKKSPVLVTADMVARMLPGSIIIDLAAERGGNCALTRPDETVVTNGVTVLGPTNLPGEVPFHASQMYSRNVVSFVKEITRDGALALSDENEIHRETLVTRGGDIAHPRIEQLLGSNPPPSGGGGRG